MECGASSLGDERGASCIRVNSRSTSSKTQCLHMFRIIGKDWLLSLLCLLWVSSATGVPQAPDSAPFQETVRPFLAKNCNFCHNVQLTSGDLNLEVYSNVVSMTQNREQWEKILKKLQTGEMPPKGLPRPNETELKQVTGWIEREFDRADRLAKPNPGRVTARRLNRTEYNNTMRDLLALDLEPAGDFPQDDSAFGFDNIADALSLSPLLMEKYLAASERISRLAVFGPELKAQTVRFEPTQPRRSESANPVRVEQPAFYTMTDYDVSGIGHPGAFHLAYRFPAAGEYLFRIRAAGARPSGSEPQQLDLWIDRSIVQTFEVPDCVTATNERLPIFVEVRLKVSAGQHQMVAAFPRLFEGLPIAFGGPNPSQKPPLPPPDPEKFFQPLKSDATPRQVQARKAAIERFRARARQPQFDGLAVAEFEIVGPYAYTKGPSLDTLRKVYVCGHLSGGHQAGCAQRIVSSLAGRAFRRPVAAEEIEPLLATVFKAQERGRSFEQGIALALQAILVSPDFLFRIEKDPGPIRKEGAHPLGQYELASRLSYFLWSSMPDEELMRRAGEGALRKPDVIAAQVRRMLKDARSRSLVENFAGQWLEIRRLESVQPERDRFPDFDDYLRSSMLKETELLFQHLLQEDGNILDLIDGEYTFLNERLARHYGISGVAGPEFRKVALTGTARSGVLTHASVLTVSSYANRTSPVLRGKWILETLLNAPPPHQPANVPSLDEAAIGSTASLRQQLEVHRQDPVCASCHARMDPLGFGLENYDAVGAWRTLDGKFPVDPSGLLPDGRSFKGPEDLKKILKEDRDAFTEGLTEKLLIYALGRGVERYDRGAVRRIAADVASNQYRFSNLVLGIVNSLPFQFRSQQQESSRAKSQSAPRAVASAISQ